MLTIDPRVADELAKQTGLPREKVYKAIEKANLTLEEELGKKEEPKEEPEIKFNFKKTPKEIKEHLDRYVIGQEELKKRLAIAAAYHYKGIEYLQKCREGGTKPVKIRKKNIMVYGPTGCGKTFTVEKLAEFLDVPCIIVDATDFTEAGYVGKDVDSMVRDLIEMAPGKTDGEKIARARHGIIFIDEVDKKAKDEGWHGSDISREGFQRALLKLVEEKDVPVDDPFRPKIEMVSLMGSSQKKKEAKTISTKGILFICGGSFSRPANSLEDLVKERLTGKRNDKGHTQIRGFAKDSGGGGEESNSCYLSQAKPDDFFAFGMIPELVGRFPVHSHVNPLAKSDLVRIMKESEDSILDQYKAELELYGIKIEFSDDAIDYVAEEASKQKTGARGLLTVWERILADYLFELPSINIKELKVTRELAEKPREHFLRLIQKSPFADFCEYFRREHGIGLAFSGEAEQYVFSLADVHGKDVPSLCRELIEEKGYHHALKLIGVKTFELTRESLEDVEYFNRLVTEHLKNR